MAAAGYSFAEACAMLGISAHTLRRRIRDGLVEARRVERPQGYAWVVYLEQVPAAVTSEQPAEQTSHDPAAGSDVTTNEPAATRNGQPAGAGTHVTDGQALALALAPLVEASVNAAVAPLRAELAEVRHVLSARDQELGRLSADLAALRIDRDQLADEVRALRAPRDADPSPDALGRDSEGGVVEPAQRRPKASALVALLVSGVGSTP